MCQISSINGSNVQIKGHLTCQSQNVIYAIINVAKKRFYIGSTIQQFSVRGLENWRNITGYYDRQGREIIVPEWVLDIKDQWNGASLDDVIIVPLTSFQTGLMSQVLRQQEEMLIKSLQPHYNSRCNEVKWRIKLINQTQHPCSKPNQATKKRQVCMMVKSDNIHTITPDNEDDESRFNQKKRAKNQGKVLRSGKITL